MKGAMAVNPLILGVMMGLLVSLMPRIGKALKERRKGSEKYQRIMADFKQQVEAALDEGETVQAMCGYIPCAAVTNKRLLVSTKTGLDTVSFGDIVSLKGLNGAGEKTSDPDAMLVFTIKAKKKYTLGNHSDGFNQVVTSLRFYTGL